MVASAILLRNCGIHINDLDHAQEWLGLVPFHWTVRRFRYSATIPNGQVDPRLPDFSEQVLIAPNHIESGTGRLLEYSTADEQAAISGKYQFRKGEILYSKIRPELAKACVAPCDGLCSADMYPVRPRGDMSPTYLSYLLISTGFTEHVVLSSSRVAMPKVNREELGDAPVIVPPREEQELIARFLDRETAKLDALIAKKQRLIELLQEKRTALISQAVTSGIDSGVKLKDTGVEWLGQVPEHWAVAPFKHYVSFHCTFRDFVP